MITPVKNLHGLSPTEDWIQQCSYLEHDLHILKQFINSLPETVDVFGGLVINGYTFTEFLTGVVSGLHVATNRECMIQENLAEAVLECSRSLDKL